MIKLFNYFPSEFVKHLVVGASQMDLQLFLCYRTESSVGLMFNRLNNDSLHREHNHKING